MLKTRIVKLALAALLAVPAVSASAKVHHKRLTHVHATAISASKTHRLHHVSRSRNSLTATKGRSHKLSSTKHHVIKTSSQSRLKITKMPPTIDNL